MKHIVLSSVFLAFFCTQTALGASGFTLSATTQVKKQDETLVVSPYNQASFLGTGNNGTLTLLLPEGKLDIPLESPLYHLTNAYRDQLLFTKDTWGIRRYVQKTVFDGTEDWQISTDSLYRHSNTTVFTLSLEQPAAIPDLLCSHFQTMLDSAQKTNTIDGVSLSKDLKTLTVRVMNFRNMKTVEAFTSYLASQNAAFTPFTILTASRTPSFTPFSSAYQSKLSQIDVQKIGLIDSVMPELTKEENTGLPDCFLKTTVSDPELLSFAQAVTDIKVYNGDASEPYTLSSFRLLPDGSGEVTILRETKRGDLLYTGTLSFQTQSFTQTKPVELRLSAATAEAGSISVYLDLNRFFVPQKALSFADASLSLSPQCFMEKQLVVPAYVPLPAESQLQIFENNILLHGSHAAGDRLSLSAAASDEASSGGSVTLTASSQPERHSLYLNGEEKAAVTLVPIADADTSEKELHVMLLGDSLIKQQYYPSALEKAFQDDSLKLTLVGTGGTETALHEGRGGWTAYDYCRTDKKYGEENPFLHNGKFDFSAYMQKNHFDAIDIVVLNLGINDLNLAGHNSNDEIFSYFQEMVESIRAFAPNCKIMFNTPTMLFAQDNTESAKNTRLAFIQSLYEIYGDRAKEGYYVIPIYLSLDPFLDYRFEPRKLNAENQDKSMQVTDTTHPGLSGYEKIAFMTYSYIKYALSESLW